MHLLFSVSLGDVSVAWKCIEFRLIVVYIYIHSR